MKEHVREHARRLGLERIGFTTADVFAAAGLRLAEWLDSGRHGTMRYLAKEPHRRADPRTVLPSARSLVVAAVPYAPAPDARLAAYARLADYHREIARRLEELGAEIERLVPGTEWRVCVDTKPLLERAAAASAGLGWIGKSTMLLDVEHGPWTMLGVLVTSLELEADPPAKERCGTCSACLDACPTQAFVAPYVLDARRCLSYWTIEHRGPHPEEIREAQGSRVFGCDDCLTACPFGPPPRDASGAEVLPVAPELATLTPRETIRRLEEGFGRNFGRFAVARAGKAGLLRNALTALGHEGGTEALAICRRYVDHPDDGVRIHARWAVERLEAVEAGG